MGNEQNNNTNQNPENQNFNNSNNHEQPHLFEEHHHKPHHHHHGCGMHARREPFTCTEKFCAQKLIFKAFKILFVLGFAFMIFVSGIVVGVHMGHRNNSSIRDMKIQSIPYERSIRGGNSSHQYEIQIEPGHQMQKEYFFRFGN